MFTLDTCSGLDDVTMSVVNRLKHDQLSSSDISVLMQDSFAARQKWIVSKRPLLQEIFRNFPPLGNILSEEVVCSLH
jgi:hypothetical protein